MTDMKLLTNKREYQKWNRSKEWFVVYTKNPQNLAEILNVKRAHIISQENDQEKEFSYCIYKRAK